MKRLFSFLSMAVAAMTIIGCQEKEIETYEPIPNEGSTFELIAEIAQTKTTLDAETYKVAWEEDDVIYMVTSGADTPWATAAEFTYADGKFNTESTIDDVGTYTMNALYAASNQAKYHKNTGTTHKLQSIQTQDCENPTAHIKENDALTGTFTANIPSDEPATVKMNHIYTLMQVDVKNNTGADINITKFEMTVPGADLAGVFAVDFETPGVATNSSASETITVNVTNGTVEAGASLPVYFVAAPFTSDVEKGIEFKVTTESGATYTKTAKKALEFQAGQYNTTPYTISTADVVAPNVTWDLTTASYESASAAKVVWSSEFVNLTLEKGGSTNNADNYLGGTGEYDHTRVYKSHVMTFAPVGKYQIENIEFAVLSGYTDAFETAEWTNGNASTSENTVTVTPVDGHKKVSAVLGAATRFSAIKVYYSYDEDYELPTVASIAVEGQKTELVQGAEFDFGGTVTATYTNDETADVTSKAQFTGYDMSTPGEQTVTVSYTEEEKTVTTTYALTVLSADADITDVLNLALTGASGSTYSTWADKTSSSSAVYAGNSAGNNNSIQLRSNNNNSGVVTTTSGGYAKKVVVEWNTNTANGRTLNVYGKNTAYEAAADLYVSNNQGTLLGTIKYDGEITKVELEILGKYQYVGFRSADGAMYISTIEITWASEASDAPTVPELSVGSDIIEVSSEGGNAGFDYTVIYPVVGVEASASTSVDWISDFNYDTDGRVEFFVSENTLANEREAVVTLAYEGAAKPMTVTIKQKAAESQEPETPETGETSFVKVTSTPTDWTGDYLIVYEAGNLAFNGGLTTLDVASNGKSVTITDGKIVATPEITACKFSIDASGHIKSASGYYIGNTADSNKLNSSTSTQYTNTIVINDDGTAQITGSGKSILRYNATSGQERFRYFKSSTYTSQKAIALYKLQ